MVAASEGPGQFRVKADTSAKGLSGALAAQARLGTDPLVVQAIGPDSVNQGLKAIIIARGNVAGNSFDFVIRPDAVSAIGPDALRITINKAAPQPDATPTESNVLRVNATSRPGALAGAIAGKVRDGATVLSATGIGPAAVLKIAKAIALAREYVKEAGWDICAVPRFVDLKVGDAERTGVCFDILATKA